ncbi:hypothetical protein [Sphingosinicella terrae]|uniref:hypothetical protein n=1 Tax=Sphingosinicella terrae TaxID=2172047 RepID=UPI000E0DE13B|nr:hypothetical protein [Sphingosinicella terrae]
MALPPSPSSARDQFERHYAEKIWALIPEIYRHEDGVSHRPGQLRALVEILAEQAAVARRSVDRLLADSRIEEADDWAIPYIGALLGTRMVSAFNPAGRRADVGHTIGYRRRAGTPHLLEALADDIADWDAVVGEGYKGLARNWHMLDTSVPSGAISRTPRGGYANLRNVRVSDIIEGPFDDLAHRPDVRRAPGRRGLYNIPNVNLFLFRQYAFALVGVTPFRLDATHYTLDPSGRDVPLFQPGREDRADCAARNEWDVRAPIGCRRLNAATYRLADDPTFPPAWAPLIGRTFFSQQSLFDATTGLGPIDREALLAAAMTAQSPRGHLVAGGFGTEPAIDLAVGAAGDPSLTPHQLAGAELSAWAETAVTDAWTALLLDPATGRVRLTAAPGAGEALQIRTLHYGAFSPVGAGTHNRQRTVPSSDPAALQGLAPNWSTIGGNRMLDSSATYAPTAAGGAITVDADATMWATDRNRPYVTLRPPAGQREIRLSPDASGRSIEINGLWIGLLLDGVAPDGDLAEIVFDGQWQRILLRDVTLDPGGDRAVLVGDPAVRIAHVRLVIEGVVEELVVERSVIGSVAERGLGSDAPCTAASIRISDSIVRGYADQPALSVGSASVELDRVTMIGDCRCGRADISDSIIDGEVRVEDAQSSCFRFSTARSGGRIPAQYESLILPEGLPAGTFVSDRFGDPGHLQLSESCLPEIAAGGENGSEMGAFNRALDTIKRADLRAKVQEYAPVQARVQFRFVT